MSSTVNQQPDSPKDIWQFENEWDYFENQMLYCDKKPYFYFAGAKFRYFNGYIENSTP